MAEKVSLSLKWESHQETVLHSLETSFGAQDFVDLTLACEGQSVQAHRVVVSACSSFLKRLLQDHPVPHPIVILKDITMLELKQLLEFMYCGQVTVEHQQLESLLHAAHVLGVRGLTDVDSSEGTQSTSFIQSEEEVNDTDSDQPIKSKSVTLSGNKSILASYLNTPPCGSGTNSVLASYLSTPPCAKSLSLAELLAQPALNTDPETPKPEHENNGSFTDTLSEIDLDVKQEEVDLGVESEYQDTENEEMTVDLDDNINTCPKGIGKATAFMLTLAKRANRVAALPYSAQRLTDLNRSSSLTVGKSSLFYGPNTLDEELLSMRSKDVQLNESNSGHSKADDSSAEQKLAFYEARPCSVCGKMYRDAASLRTHMSIMHTSWRDGFECSCKQVFDTKYEMYQHRRSHGKSLGRV